MMSGYDNPSVAAVLDNVGDLLEIAGESTFRVLSYHKAAHALRSFPVDVNTLVAQGRVQEIPGVGSKLAASIAALLSTGGFPELETLSASLPLTLTQLLEVPGLGPKKIKVLYGQLDIASIDDLEVAIAGGRLNGLPGFGAKTVVNLTAGIEAFRRHHERSLISTALPMAERIVAMLGDLDGVEAAAYTGSVRRHCETVGDVDVLVVSTRPEIVMQAAREMPRTARVVVSGETKTSVLSADGIQVDVEVVAPDDYGAALQQSTGSVEHNIALREIATSRGLKLSEHGVFRLDTGQRVAGRAEEDVYAALGMATPPPELRENTGELEAALAGTLPRLITRADLLGDLHMHTLATDGKSTIEQTRARAAELGYRYIAITDHAERLRMVGGLDLDALERQWEHIDELNALSDGPYILKGIELNIDDDGEVDYPADVLARFDITLASLHSGWGQNREVATRRLLRVMDNPFVDVIGHPTGRILGRRDPIDLDMEAVLTRAAETGTAMELNAYPDRLDLSDVHLRMARRLGVSISLGTDSHEASQLSNIEYGIVQARRGWLEPSDVLNCCSLDQLQARLKRARSH